MLQDTKKQKDSYLDVPIQPQNMREAFGEVGIPAERLMHKLEGAALDIGIHTYLCVCYMVGAYIGDGPMFYGLCHVFHNGGEQIDALVPSALHSPKPLLSPVVAPLCVPHPFSRLTCAQLFST
jgi:hypothetical protein